MNNIFTTAIVFTVLISLAWGGLIVAVAAIDHYF